MTKSCGFIVKRFFSTWSALNALTVSIIFVSHKFFFQYFIAEVEFSRTSSRTLFKVLGLGLEASSPRKLPCPRLEDSTRTIELEFCCKTPETSRKICEYLFCFCLLEHKRSQGRWGGQGGRPPFNWNFTNDKNVTKKSIVSSVSFYHFSLTTVTNNNIEDHGPSGSPQFIFYLPI